MYIYLQRDASGLTGSSRSWQPHCLLRWQFCSNLYACTDVGLTHGHMFRGMDSAFEHVCGHCEMSAGHPSRPHESIRACLSAWQKRQRGDQPQKKRLSATGNEAGKNSPMAKRLSATREVNKWEIVAIASSPQNQRAVLCTVVHTVVHSCAQAL